MARLRSRTWARVIPLALLFLLAACGEVPAPGSPGDSNGRRLPATPSAVEEPDASDAITEEVLALVADEIAALERATEPAEGTSRDEVERRFGPGRAAQRPAKVRLEVLPDSPYRAYELLPPRVSDGPPDAVLFVRYDGDWNVRRAHFLNPYSTKGRPLVVGMQVPLAERHREATRRLAQMRRIREEVRRRFGE